MYQVPLRYIKVSSTVAICATRITAIMSYNMTQAENMIREERKSGKLINACGRLPIQTAIILDNGTIIASPLSIQRLINAIDRANTKQTMPTRGRELKRFSVYDVVDNEEECIENPEEIDYSEMSFGESEEKT